MRGAPPSNPERETRPAHIVHAGDRFRVQRGGVDHDGGSLVVVARARVGRDALRQDDLPVDEAAAVLLARERRLEVARERLLHDVRAHEDEEEVRRVVDLPAAVELREREQLRVAHEVQRVDREADRDVGVVRARARGRARGALLALLRLADRAQALSQPRGGRERRVVRVAVEVGDAFEPVDALRQRELGPLRDDRARLRASARARALGGEGRAELEARARARAGRARYRPARAATVR